MSNKKPVVQFQIEEKVKKQLETIAKKEHRTFAAQCRLILETWLKSNGIVVVVFVCLCLIGCGNPVTSASTPLGECIYCYDALYYEYGPVKYNTCKDTFITCAQCEQMAKQTRIISPAFPVKDSNGVVIFLFPPETTYVAPQSGSWRTCLKEIKDTCVMDSLVRIGIN